MRHQIIQRADLQRRFMGCFQQHWRRKAGTARFFPTRSAKAPAIPRRKSGKTIFRARRGKIIPRRLAEIQKRGADFGTDHMQPDILRPGIAAAITKKPCQRRH